MSSSAPREAIVGGPAQTAGWRTYAELTKPGLTSLVLVTTGLGYLIGAAGAIDWGRLVWAVLGTALVGGGANGLNQWWETAADRRMKRTRDRPLPSRRISSRGGFVFSVVISVLGVLVLLSRVNGLTATLGVASWAIYLFAYTPLKPRSTLNTLVGAVSGAIPPMMGWAAATGRLDPPAWVLFGILFTWQIPHFLAIAWVYRADYAAGGFRMLPVIDPQGRATFRTVVLYSVGLLGITVVAPFVGLGGWIYLLGATVLGGAFFGTAIRLYREGTDASAMRLFLSSIAYLPAIFCLMLLDPTRLPL